jgi:hypothetical protein
MSLAGTVGFGDAFVAWSTGESVNLLDPKYCWRTVAITTRSLIGSVEPGDGTRVLKWGSYARPSGK